MGATVVDHQVPNDFLFDNGISYFFGDIYNKNGNNMNWSLYEMQLIELGNVCYEKLENNLKNWKKKMKIENKNNINLNISPEKPTLFASGLIVRCPIIDNGEYAENIYKIIIDKFKINNIYVIEDERLKNTFNNIIKQMRNINLELISRLVVDTKINEEIQRQKSLSKYFWLKAIKIRFKRISLHKNKSF